MPRQGSLTVPIQFRCRHTLPSEVKDFPRDDKYFKYVPPPTYLICLSPKDLYR